MFAEHQPPIGRIGRSGPAGWRKVACFVVATIKVPLEHASRDAPKIARGERPANSIFGIKHTSLDYLDEHAAELWSFGEHLCATLDGEALDDALVELAIGIPGIGFAKAGFITQLIYGRSACLDTHNIVRFGLEPRAFRAFRPTIRAKTLRRKIRAYNQVCAALGGTEALWNGWCAYVATARPVGISRSDKPDTISELHLKAVL